MINGKLSAEIMLVVLGRGKKKKEGMEVSRGRADLEFLHHGIVIYISSTLLLFV